LKNKIKKIVTSSAIAPLGVIANTERKSGANVDSNEKLRLFLYFNFSLLIAATFKILEYMEV
jgi:hypothetical protein